MKKIKGLLLLTILAACILLPVSHASADAVTEKPYLSLGADLNASEKEKVLELLGINEADLDEYTVVTVTI